MVIFRGKISSGLGRHSELVIPGKKKLLNAPSDWPDRFASGSLNVQIVEYPPILRSHRKQLKALDRGLVPPSIVIPQHEIANNSLRRKLFKPRRGTGQAWRATLHAHSHSMNVWVFRRIGSHMHDCLELISEKRIRESLNIRDQDEVHVVLHS
ncbi:DUF120 domain-containing protein [Ochrobactrum chromiisoli]|uniref:DUF120 domain-containing protein n=1 Tax=Ochrobactrum chromiisoli TaxID=2993941 RepID=A0ABT3QIZ0_9HYPH|nr:DUF120 domain-containing protein [Ochrobactrum chromiisoli]MCX2695545.1 DUF120 domain-containing protein [Ochrobactrum chromiisoli]